MCIYFEHFLWTIVNLPHTLNHLCPVCSLISNINRKNLHVFNHADLDVDRRQTGDGHVHREVVPTGVEDARNLHLPVGDESNRGASRTELVPAQERLCLNHHRSIT